MSESTVVNRGSAGDRRASARREAAISRPQRPGRAATFTIGLVLVAGAVWYYFYANAASQTLAERDFRQLNQLAEHANGVLNNFAYLFQFSLLQESNPSAAADASSLSLCDGSANESQIDIVSAARCHFGAARQSGEARERSPTRSGYADAIREAAAIAEGIREREASRLERYFAGIHNNRFLQNVSIEVVPQDSDLCETPTGNDARGSPIDEVVYRVEGPPGNKVIAIIDCREPGDGAVDIRRRLAARLPLADLFTAQAVNLDFDQIGVIDQDNEVLYLSTQRINRRNRHVGRLIDTSTVARITRLDGDESAGEEGDAKPVTHHSTTILERKLGNIDYKIFVQPHVPSLPPVDNAPSAKWSIIGLKQTKRFNVERFPLPAYQFGIFAFAFLLSVILLPSARLLFLSQGTSLSRFDFSVLIVSLAMATGTAMVTGLMVDTHLKMTNDQKSSLVRLSRAIRLQLTEELRVKYAALQRAEAEIVSRYAPPPNAIRSLFEAGNDVGGLDRNALVTNLVSLLPAFDELRDDPVLSRDSIRMLEFWANTDPLYRQVSDLVERNDALVAALPGLMSVHSRAHELVTPLKEIPLDNFNPACWNAPIAPSIDGDGSGYSAPGFDLAWLINANGNQTGSQITFRKSPVRFISVPNRKYFQRAAQGRVWRPPWLSADGSAGFFVERVFSRIAGSRVTILSKPVAPRHLLRSQPISDCEPKVAAVATRMFSMVNPLLPHGFGFAVIDDTDGTVLYHSDDDVSLIENFYTETANNKSLLAATQHDEPDHFTANYSGREVLAYVAPVNRIPWSLVVYRDREVNATMAFGSALYAVSLIAVIALIVFINMEILHQRGSSASRAWWPHRRNVRAHAFVTLLSVAYAIGVLACLDLYITEGPWPMPKIIVAAAIFLGPYLLAALSLLWRDSAVERVLIAAAVPIVALWAVALDGQSFTILCLLFGGAIVLVHQCLGAGSRIADHFRIIHAIAGVAVFTAIAGTPAILFYTDALTHFLEQEESLKAASFATGERQHRDARKRYESALRETADPVGVYQCFGRYARPTGDHDSHAPCVDRGLQVANAGLRTVRTVPESLFTTNMAHFLSSWTEPRTSEIAMLRPRSGAPTATGTAVQAVGVNRYVSRAFVTWILLVTGLFLYVVSRVVSRRLFGLQGADARNYLQHWPCERYPDCPRPDIERLRLQSLLVGYSPSDDDLALMRKRYVVASMERIAEVRAEGRTVILHNLESALREVNADTGREYRRELRRLQLEARRIVLCCEVVPSYWLSHAVDDERAEVSGGLHGRKRWLQLLDGFRAYAAPRGADNDTPEVAVTTDTAQLLRNELAAFPELAGLYQQLAPRVRGMRRNELLAAVFHAAHGTYARKWYACTLTEQALLLQIARKELVNPDQYEVLGSLEVRGLIRRDPRIRAANQTFLWFVENASISEELSNHSIEYQRNQWQAMRWPVLIVLGLAALFLFQLGFEKIEIAVGALGSLLALATVVRQLWVQIHGSVRPKTQG